MNPQSQAKTERIDIRINPQVKRLLQEAAAVKHQNVTEFVVSSVVAAAEQALADRRYFLLNDAKWEEFLEVLDRPTTAKPRLERLLRERSALEK